MITNKYRILQTLYSHKGPKDEALRYTSLNPLFCNRLSYNYMMLVFDDNTLIYDRKYVLHAIIPWLKLEQLITYHTFLRRFTAIDRRHIDVAPSPEQWNQPTINP